MYSVTIRRGTLSQLIAPWGSGVVVGPSTATAASVIGLSLLPLPAGQSEIVHQRGGDQEGDHRHRDRRPLAELTAWDAALEGQGGHQVGRVHRAAAGNGVDELEV